MAAHDESMEDGFPAELQDRVNTFDEALSSVEAILQPLHNVPLTQVHTEITPLDKARLDLVGVYAINSLFWMFLNAKGENPKEHGVKGELDRVRSYMDRVKEVQEKLTQKAPRLNVDASKRFVRSALWQAAHKKAKDNQGQEPKAADSTSPAQPTSTAPKNLETRLSAANIPNENQHKAGKRSHRENSSGKKKKIKQHTE